MDGISRRRDLPKSRLFIFVGCTPLVLEKPALKFIPAGVLSCVLYSSVSYQVRAYRRWSVINQRRDLSNCSPTRFSRYLFWCCHTYFLYVIRFSCKSFPSTCIGADAYHTFIVLLLWMDRSDCRTCCPREGLVCLHTARLTSTST